MFSNYAEINPQLNYNMEISGIIPHGYNDMPNFPITQKPLKTTQKKSKNTDNSYYCGGQSSLALKGLQMNNKVSEMYFSGENISRIQKQLKRAVFNMSEGKFKLSEDQNEEDLIIAMRAVYLDNAKNLNTEIIRQVKELNAITIDYIAPDMLTTIKQQYNYLRDINRPQQTMNHPINVNRGGRKTLPSYTSIWGSMPVTSSF